MLDFAGPQEAVADDSPARGVGKMQFFLVCHRVCHAILFCSTLPHFDKKSAF